MRFIFIVFVGLLLALPGQAQERVRNVRIRAVDSSQIEIRYNLIQARPGDSVYFDARSRLRGTLRVLPEFVQGDVGQGITVGSDRQILWNALANGYSFNEEIQVIVRVRAGVPTRLSEPVIATRTDPKPTQPVPTTPNVTQSEPVIKPTPAPVRAKTSPDESVTVTESTRPVPAKPAPVAEPPVRREEPPVTITQPVPRSEPATTLPPVTEAPVPTEPELVQRRYNGPAWALVSAVAPGIGNIFVQRPRPKVGMRPLLTVGSYGLAIYGILQKQKAKNVFAVYEQQKNAATAEPFYQTANQHNHRYYAATRMAITVAAADVILTFFKGIRNNQLRRESRLQNLSIGPGIQAGQPTAYLRISL